MSKSWPKVFRDPVHNLIAFDNNPCDRLLLDLINTPEVQRLRRIKQMGVTELVFPGANHSRFAHSLGVCHTAKLFLDQLERVSGSALPDEQRALLLSAALLHDVGHGPFSHAFEQVTGKPHEAYTHAIIQSDETEVHRCLRGFDEQMPSRLASFFDEDADEENRPWNLPAYLGQIVSGQLDADRCDYLLRDSHATGTNYGDYDLTWMLAQLRPDAAGKRFYLTRKGLSAAETYLFARFHMYRTVYFHKTSRAAEVMLKMLFRRIKDNIDNDCPNSEMPKEIFQAFSAQICLTNYLSFDDHTITELMKSCTRSDDPILCALGGGLLHRRLYKAFDVSSLFTPQELERTKALHRRVEERMAQLGLDPRYCFVEDSASDTPYEPYHPDVEKPGRQIFVEAGNGKIVEISTLSDALGQLRKTYTVVRWYVPPEFRDELQSFVSDLDSPERTLGDGP
jgi:hypothetical protein